MTALKLPLCLGLLAVLSACSQQPATDDSLFQDLGGKPGITRIVEGMLLNVARDARIVHHFRNVDPVRLRAKLIEGVCVEAGGPCTYTGDSLAEVHKGQHITPAEFDALAQDLAASMNAQGIPVTVQNRLLAVEAKQRGEVIGK